MKNKAKVLLAAALVSVTAVGGIIVANSNVVAPATADATTYTLTLDEANIPSGLTDEYQTSVAQAYGYPTINYTLAKKADGSHVQLAPHGRMLNFASTSSTGYGRISGIQSIKAKFTGSLKLKTSMNPGGSWLTEASDLVSDTAVDVSGTSPDYLYLEAGDDGAVIESLVIQYSCDYNEIAYQIEDLGTLYTGTDADGVVWKMTRSGTSVTVETLNKETNDSYSGTIITSNDTVNLRLVSDNAIYVGDIEDGGNKIAYDSASGAYASAVPHVDLYRVHNVQDFESYDKTGVGYDQSHTLYTTTGLRASYMSDYYAGSNGSMWGASGWNKMGSTDYLTYNGTGGHNSSKTGLFKSSSNGLRFISDGVFYGLPYGIGKGSYFSFWAHGALNSSGVSNGLDTTVKIRLYSAMKVTTSNIASTETEQSFTIPAGSDWTQYKFAIDSSKTYYGYMVYTKSSSTGYVPMDDMQIFTTDPYSVYTPAPVANYKKTLTAFGNLTLTDAAATAAGVSSVSMMVGLGSNGYSFSYIWGQDGGASNYDVDADGNVTMDLNFTQSTLGVTITGLTGKLSDDGTSITDVTLAGTAASYIANNGSITLAESGFYKDSFESDTSTLQTTYKRWYNNGSWNVDTGNADRLTKTTETSIHGDAAMKIRAYSSGYFRVTFASDYAEATHVGGIAFWMYNGSGATYDTRIYTYAAANCGSYNQIWGKSIASTSEWVYVQCGIDADIYNLGIWFKSGAAGAPIIDYLTLY